MMDYDKLIDDLRVACVGNQYNIMGVAAVAIETLREDLEQERTHRIHAEQHADAFMRDCERLNAELARAKARILELETAHRTELCENGYDCVELGKARAELDRVTAERNALIKRTAGDCWACIRRYECNSRKGPHRRCWEFDPWLLKED